MEENKYVYEVRVRVSHDDVPPEKNNFFWNYLAMTLALVVLVNTCLLMPLFNDVTSFSWLQVTVSTLMAAVLVYQIFVVYILKARFKEDIERYAMSKAIITFSQQLEKLQKAGTSHGNQD